MQKIIKHKNLRVTYRHTDFKMSWGSDLWDQYNAVLAISKRDTEDLDGTFAKFVKERGDIEKDYAKKMRRLVDRFNPKENKKDEEPSLTRGFR